MSPQLVQVLFLGFEISMVVLFTTIWYRVSRGGRR